MRHLPLIPPTPAIPVVGTAPDAVDRIEIPIPCTISWDAMVGDARVRHCGECRQNVYNLASFSRPEALRLLQASAGGVCLRIFRRPDGTVITADCRARLRAARQRGLLVYVGVLLIVLWAQVSAQFVGWIGLRRVLAGGIQGQPRISSGLAPKDPGASATQPRLPSPSPPPRVPMMGEPARPHLMGKRAPSPADEELRGKPMAGRLRIKPPAP